MGKQWEEKRITYKFIPMLLKAGKEVKETNQKPNSIEWLNTVFKHKVQIHSNQHETVHT